TRDPSLQHPVYSRLAQFVDITHIDLCNGHGGSSFLGFLIARDDDLVHRGYVTGESHGQFTTGLKGDRGRLISEITDCCDLALVDRRHGEPAVFVARQPDPRTTNRDGCAG